MTMRLALIAAILLSLSTGLLAADWTRYVNPRFGAGADIPPGFVPDGAPAIAGEGDGKTFSAGPASIAIWGAPLPAGDFSREIAARIAADEAEGWTITYRSETPHWAAWSGSRAGRAFHARAIPACAGGQTANMRFEYLVAEMARFDSIASRLGQSLDQDGACF